MIRHAMGGLQTDTPPFPSFPFHATRESVQEVTNHVCQKWIQQEAGYKAEIKRLELIVANTSREGMAGVAVARSGSLVNRTHARGLVAKLKRVSDSRDQGR